MNNVAPKQQNMIWMKSKPSKESYPVYYVLCKPRQVGVYLLLEN